MSRRQESVTQVLTLFVQHGGDQDQMSVDLLQEQVELHLEYAEGSLSKWQNFLRGKMRAFFHSKNPASVHSALTWASKAPQPAPVPRHRPGAGKEWNGTANPIRNAAGVVTGYGGGWVLITAYTGEYVDAHTDDASSDISCDDRRSGVSEDLA